MLHGGWFFGWMLSSLKPFMFVSWYSDMPSALASLTLPPLTNYTLISCKLCNESIHLDSVYQLRDRLSKLLLLLLWFDIFTYFLGFPFKLFEIILINGLDKINLRLKCVAFFLFLSLSFYDYDFCHNLCLMLMDMLFWGCDDICILIPQIQSKPKNSIKTFQLISQHK